MSVKKIGNRNISDEMKSSYLSYAMSVIVSRALPDARDGLKPVHRRIIYAMYKGGYDWSKQFRKSARVVGDVIGKYHPHGDQAVYDALVRLAQDFSMNTKLLDGQGNFGSLDGDRAAAMRYTETKLAKISEYLISDIDKNTVSFQNNYDDSEVEPTVLPAQFPNLLVNGAGGIAVGMATNIPPHNLGEVIDATLGYLDDNKISVNELMKKIPGPDFPTGGVILGKSEIKNGYEKGRGSIKLRGEVEIEENAKDRKLIVIKSFFVFPNLTSPDWAINPSITLWNATPSYIPFSDNSKNLFTWFGATSLNSSIFTSPYFNFIVTFGFSTATPFVVNITKQTKK